MTKSSGVRYFCTLFDRNYLYKGAVMLHSLTRHNPNARTYVLCLDETTRLLLRRLAIPGVVTIALEDVETDQILEAKRSRSIAEYCWTLTSVVLWHVMQKNSDIGLLTYLDADLMFFSSAEPIFAEMGEASILAIEHHYPLQSRHFEIYGKFNVQWVSFRRDPDGLRCLEKWRSQCLEWCFARIEDGKHGDQKYLDDWPRDYGKSFHNLRHVGAGLAPWNYINYRIERRNERFWVDGLELIFYHFHQFQILAGGGFNHFRTRYFEGAAPPEHLYQQYWSELREMIDAVRQIAPEFQSGTKALSMVNARRTASLLLPTRLKNFLKRLGFRA
jgi:hypothetical protein